MSGFSFLELNSTFREKVINKCESKSYFHLQQTCRDVLEFIRHSSHISVPLTGKFEMPVYPVSESPAFLSIDNQKLVVEIASLYGIRLEELVIQDENDFDHSITRLKNLSISCKGLVLLNKKWAKEQCEALLKMVKPVKIKLNRTSVDSNRFEALFQSKILRSVKVDLKVENTEAATLLTIETLLPRMSELFIHALDRPPTSIIQDVLQIFFSGGPWPHLRRFHLWTRPVFTGYWLDPFRQIMKSLTDYKVECTDVDMFLVVYSVKSSFPDGTPCKVEVRCRSGNVHIIYKTDNVLPI